MKTTAVYKNPLDKHLVEVVNVSWNYAGRVADWQDAVMNAVLGLGGEAGEIVDLHKKMFYHKDKDRREELVNELGDLYFYLAKLQELHDITMEECLAANREKLTERHSSMFKESK